MQKRVHREWRAMAEGKVSLPANSIITVREELRCKTLLFFFPGPEESPYRDDILTLALEIPENYPYKPPTLFPRTEIFHPSIMNR